MNLPILTLLTAFGLLLLSDSGDCKLPSSTSAIKKSMIRKMILKDKGDSIKRAKSRIRKAVNSFVSLYYEVWYRYYSLSEEEAMIIDGLSNFL
jgi:hypothetical protein